MVEQPDNKLDIDTKKETKESHKDDHKDKEKVAEERKKRKEQDKKDKEEAKKKKDDDKKKVATEEKDKKEKIHKKVEFYPPGTKLVRPNKGQKILFNPSKKNILITFALPYVNNVPHLGNLIGCVLSADVYARYCRLMGYNTLYICGTDEYGTATETKAIQEKCTPQELCDKYHGLHAKIYEWFDIDFDYFGRTSTPIHSEITHDIFFHLYKNGYIKKQEIQQQFCIKCNMFLSDRFVVGICPHCKSSGARGDQCDTCAKLINQLDLIEPHCLTCKEKPEIKSTKHYFLELPDIEENLKIWIDKASEKGDWSQNSKNITYGFLKEGLKPRCITRNLKWGVEVPTDDPDLKNKVFYVWFDAPIGYLSITANFLGPDWKDWWYNEKVDLYQFMGKDNVTFHSIIFPSTLLGTKQNFTLVHHLATTDYLNYEDKKFSKTHNTGVFGDDAINTGINSEVWRFYLLANRPEQSDSIFKWSDLALKNNSELLAKIGNLCNRALKFCYSKYDKKTPNVQASAVLANEITLKLLKDTDAYVKKFVQTLEQVKIKEGLKIIIELAEEGNKFIQENEVWDLYKTDPEKAGVLIFALLNYLRVFTCLAEPYLPAFSAKVYEIMNIKYDEPAAVLLGTLHQSHLNSIANLIQPNHPMNEPFPIFKEITEHEIKEGKSKFG